MNFIISGEETDTDSTLSEFEEEPDFGKISEVFKIPAGRNLFLDLLESKKHKYYLSSNKMDLLVKYLRALLTAVTVDDDRDTNFFCKLVNLLHCFYTDTPDHKRKYLSQLLSSHSI